MLIEKIGKAAMLEQAAEECAELAQACLKAARYLRGENPTTKPADEIYKNLTEEMADVIICLDELEHEMDHADIVTWIKYKRARMKERFSDPDLDSSM